MAGAIIAERPEGIIERTLEDILVKPTGGIPTSEMIPESSLLEITKETPSGISKGTPNGVWEKASAGISEDIA